MLTSTDAVYRFADLLIASPGAQVIGVNDYIAAPKASGYRSLHVLMNIPVTPGISPLTVPAEIQLRTVPMDLWASIEHSICYKPRMYAVHASVSP